MQVKVLGSAQDAGVPQIGCACHHCADPACHRTPCSVAIVHDGRALLLDTAADLRAQWAAIGAPLEAVAWTHAHAGHVAGASLLGREGPDLRVPGIATPRLIAVLRRMAPHAQLDWRPLAPGEDVQAGPFTIRFHEIRHRAETSDTVAIEVVGDARVLYLPDTDAWDDAVEAAVSGLGPGDVLLFDATFWNADEVRHRDVTRIMHPFVETTLPRLSRMAEAGVRVVLTHLNHTNPLCDAGSAASRAVAQAGLHVARDGDVLEAGIVEPPRANH